MAKIMLSFAMLLPKSDPNFRAPDLSRKNFSGGPDIKRTYEKCSENKRKFKMQQGLSKIRNKIQNYSPKLSIVNTIADISVASVFTTRQKF